MNIELYSVKGFMGSALKSKMESALEDRHMPYAVKELSHVDDFIKAGLVSVPAFKIGDMIIQHPNNVSPDETVNKVMDYLLTEKVNTILVPVDFSEESRHAIEYAVAMAHPLKMGITLTHIHQTLYDPVSAGAFDAQLLEQTRKELTELADKLNVEHEAQNIPVPVLTHLEVGETSSSLLEILSHGQFSILIMGTRAVDNAVRRLFGTVSSEVSRHSPKPVVVIPPNAEISFPKKMVIGISEELFQYNVLEYIVSFGANNNAFLDFIRLTDDAKEFDLLSNKLSKMLMDKGQRLSGFKIHALSPGEKKIHEMLFDYTREVKADMLVLVSKHRSFLENLRHTSITKRALYQPPMPVLILHSPMESGLI